MKRMKKIFAVILSLAMVMGMSLTAYADGEGTPKITVSGLPTDVKATIKYKQVVEADQGSADGWKFVDGFSPSNTTVKDLLGMVDTGDQGVIDHAQEGTINTKISEAVATAIKNVTFETNNVVETTATNNVFPSSAEIENVNPGLYVIEVDAVGRSYIRLLAYVKYNDTNTGAVVNTEVQAKGEKLQVEKEVTENKTSVAAGETVPFKITAIYPYYDNSITAKTFKIVDKVSGGTIAKTTGESPKIDVNVSIETIDSVPADAYSITSDVDDKGFTVDFSNKYYSNYAGKKVTITYSVVAETTTRFNGVTNDVTSETTKPGNGNETEKTYAQVVTPSIQAEITKVDANNQNTKLAGAIFTLYEELADTDVSNATHIYVPAVAGGAKATIKSKGDVRNLNTGEKWLKVASIADDNDNDTSIGEAKTVAPTGVATFKGLDANKQYYVKETKAPDGYSLNEEAFKLQKGTVALDEEASGLKDVVKDGENVKVMTTVYKASNIIKFDGKEGAVVTDTTLSFLPSTGGIGTTIFTIGGCVIMIIAAALFFASRRKEAK